MGFIYKYPVQHAKIKKQYWKTQHWEQGQYFECVLGRGRGEDKARTMPITADNSKKNYGRAILS